ncbi:MAG TPA: tetratricopeptide repeat protein [Pseudomonadales bacterium]|nr:tetratricopeptide repeat protein [Pseudomonadales bacterium]
MVDPKPHRYCIPLAEPRKRGEFLLITLLVASVIAPAWAIEPADSVAHALQQLEAKRYSLARNYLDTVVADKRLNGVQRSRAYYYRGYAFLADGLYVSAVQDFERALELDPGNSTVLAELGRLYANGSGVAKNSATAFKLFQKAARAGNDTARLYVGYALLTGIGTAADVPKARYWLHEAADAGHVEALVQLARSYRLPFADPPDLDRALALYQQAVDKGSVEALNALGYMYLGAETGAPDLVRATQYFRQAADRDSPAAQTALGFMSIADRHYEAARQWFERAAAVEYPEAFAGLGRLYQEGFGVAASRARAVQNYGKGAALGDVQSQLRLASLDLAPPVTMQSTESALRWLRLAAEQDHPQGHNGLAWVLATSRFDQLRDGATAVAEANRATTLARSATTLDTLAAAYAESGDFDKAVAVQRDALAALDHDERALRDAFERHLNRYLKQQPWRE